MFIQSAGMELWMSACCGEEGRKIGMIVWMNATDEHCGWKILMEVSNDTMDGV